MKLKPTPEQKLIIKHLHGHAMVKAGPGCAKTSTLALRAKHLIETGCDPRGIAILTYGKALTLDITETLSQLLTLSFINSSELWFMRRKTYLQSLFLPSLQNSFIKYLPIVI